MTHDPIERPSHYTSSPSGVECVSVAEHMNFCLGNALKYIWRAGKKGDAIEDLKKAKWYVEREIKRLEREAHPPLRVREDIAFSAPDGTYPLRTCAPGFTVVVAPDGVTPVTIKPKPGGGYVVQQFITKEYLR